MILQVKRGVRSSGVAARESRGRTAHRLAVATAWLIAALMVSGCAKHPKMRGGTPLDVKGGYWVMNTRFYQQGKQVDADSAKAALGRVEESSGAAGRGEAFEILGRICAVGGGIGLGYGLSTLREDEEAATPFLVAGGIAAGVSIGFAIGADLSY